MLPVVTSKTLTENQSPVFISAMRTNTIGLTLAFCFLAGGVCVAADPQMGTWKLNEAKSQITPGTTKFTTVTFKNMSGNVKVTGDGIDAKGNSVHSEWTGKFDGKDYPVTGDPNSDVRSYTKIDDRTLDLTAKKGGKTTVTGRVVVAADGKSRTVTTSGTFRTTPSTRRAWQRADLLPRQQEKKFNNVEVYDKQ
jgi:hypothetical protein